MKLKEYQTKKAKYTLLYANKWQRCNPSADNINDYPAEIVAVELAAWTCYGREFMTLFSQVRIDNEPVEIEPHILHDITVAEAIEQAIAHYGDLLAAHPTGGTSCPHP